LADGRASTVRFTFVARRGLEVERLARGEAARAIGIGGPPTSSAAGPLEASGGGMGVKNMTLGRGCGVPRTQERMKSRGALSHQ